MKYALIGCGRVAANHIAAAKMNHLDIVALCDMDEQKMIGCREEFSLPERVHFYTDYKDMIETEKPELVAIATESGKHAEIAFYCIQNHCHVIIEKPIALSLEEADRIICTAQEKKVKVCTCHQNRFNKSIQKIRSAVEQGWFGKMYHGVANIRWNRNKGYYEQASWRGTWSQDGGALLNQCIHNIDLLRWMMGGEVEEVFAFTDQLKHHYLEAEDFGIALIRFKGNSYGVIEGTTNIYPKNMEETLFLFGEKGTVKAGGKSVNNIEEWMFSECSEDVNEVKKKFSENPPNVYGYGHEPLYADMIEAIEKDREPYVNGEAGKQALELVLAIYQSAQTGEKIKLPLQSGSTLAFENRFSKQGEVI